MGEPIDIQKLTDDSFERFEKQYQEHLERQNDRLIKMLNNLAMGLKKFSKI